MYAVRFPYYLSNSEMLHRPVAIAFLRGSVFFLPVLPPAEWNVRRRASVDSREATLVVEHASRSRSTVRVTPLSRQPADELCHQDGERPVKVRVAPSGGHRLQLPAMLIRRGRSGRKNSNLLSECMKTGEYNVITVEPHLTVTSLVRKPPHYSHRGSVPNCIPQCK